MASSKRKHDESASKSANKRSKQGETPKNEPATSEQRKPKADKVVSILTKEQPAFPRGGAGVLTPLERKQIRSKASQDADQQQRQSRDLFEDGHQHLETSSDEEKSLGTDTKLKKQKTKRRKEKGRPESTTTTGSEIQIGGLSYKRITTGSLILGQITSVTARALTIALPNNLTGYVPLTSISTQLNSKIHGLLDQDNEQANPSDSEQDEEVDISLVNYFKAGQYLRVSVTATTQDKATTSSSLRKRIELSIDPSLANVGLTPSNLAAGVTVQVSVSSIEDHGLVVDLALEDDNVRGFISMSQLPSGHPLAFVKTGAVFLCSVLEATGTSKVVKLTADLTKTAVLKAAPSVDAFLPGARADILINHVTDSGLSGKIMGLLDVTADVVHSGSFKDRQAFMAKYEIGKRVSGRLIANFPLSETKKLGFSVLENLLDLTDTASTGVGAEKRLALSSTIKSASVIRVEPGLGVYLRLGQDSIGFAHVSRLSDKKIDSISEVSGAFKLGSEHAARILDYNPMDGLYLVSLQQSVLQQPFLRFEDVPLGGTVKGTVERLLIGPNGVQGLIVTLAEGISGLVPQIHMADVELQHPERKFREGQTVTARVLSTDPFRRRLRLSLKKALVNSDQKVWLRFEEINAGDATVGTLTKVDRLGAVVRFYGPVRGFLPVSEMSEAYIKDATEHFRVGQVVSVTALSINAADKRLTVSCRDVNASNQSIESTLASLKPGTLTNGTVFEKSKNDVLLRLVDSDAIARLTVDHICDGSLKKRESAFSKIRVGQRLENILILQVQTKRRLVLVSNKQSLVKAAQDGTLIKTYEQLQSNAIVTGYVTNVTEDGVFVGFVGGITGLISKSQVPIDNEGQPEFGMLKLQPVTAKILSIDYKGATPRFWLTMRESPADDPVKSASTDYAQDHSKLLNTVDPGLQTITDLCVGKITKARVVSIKDTQLNVELATDVQGRIDASEAFDGWKDIKDRKRPLKQFTPKQELTVRVLGVHDTRNHKFLPLTHRKGKNTVFELSCKPSSVTTPETPSLSLQDMTLGSTWVAFINNIAEEGVWVNISPSIRGRIRSIDLSDDLSLTADLAHNFPIGSALRVHVLAVDPEKNRLDLTARSDGSAGALTFSNISKGMIVPGRVTKITDHNIIVQLGDQVVGAVELIDMADNYDEADPAKYHKNDALRVCVLGVDAQNKKVRLSARASRVLSSSMKVKDVEITSIGQLGVNDIVRGFISNVGDKGIFITLGNGITAFVRISHLSDAYLKEWKDHFQRDQLVRGRIILVDEATGQVQMTLKESALQPDYRALLTFNDLHVGDIVTAKVAKVESFGVFILVDNSEKIRGLCHRSEIAEKRVEDASKLFSEGDSVKAKVLKLDPTTRRVNFGMKASYFADATEDEPDSQAESDEVSSIGDGVDLEEELSEHDDENANEDDDSEEATNDEDAGDEDDANADGTKGLNVGGFDWYGMSESTRKNPSKRAAEASSAAEEEMPAKASKRKKRRAEIAVDRTGDLDVEGPQSVDDFERLLLSEPDSSLLWLQYMAFHLELGDADQARQIGERALRSIGLSEEAEKLNVWVALLNLENAYGDDETMDTIFQRACEYNDPQQIYSRLGSIYIQSGKHDKADELFQQMLKKFTQDPKVWINYATFFFETTGAADKGRALLPRALAILPKFTHFDLTLKFAQLEFKSSSGLAERGRTIFEGLISSFPKRVDLFNVLLDLEVKLGDKEQIRALFERIFSGRLKPKQAKYFFKRWLAFEETEGDERRIEAVKARAADWIRDSSSSSNQAGTE